MLLVEVVCSHEMSLEKMGWMACFVLVAIRNFRLIESQMKALLWPKSAKKVISSHPPRLYKASQSVEPVSPAHNSNQVPNCR
jgi:hypothetical protein